jgi:hypothetical protein
MIAFVVFVALAGLTVMIAETAIHLPQPRDAERSHTTGRKPAGRTAQREQR